jgi:hypothetical protein
MVEYEVVVGTRKRKQTRTFGAESPTAKRLKRNIRGSKYSDALHGELSRKEEGIIIRSWERFWDPSRARDILRDAGVIDRLEKQTARNFLVKALAKSRDIIKEAERYPIPFLYLAWTLVQSIEAPALVTSFVAVGAVNVGGVAKSISIGALVCSAELTSSI